MGVLVVLYCAISDTDSNRVMRMARKTPKTQSLVKQRPFFPPFFQQKNLKSVIFPPAILGPEMAAPILWAPGTLGFSCWKPRHAHKIPRLKWGGSANLIFMGVGCFSDFPVGSQESVLKVPKRGQFHAAIRVATKRCDSCMCPRSSKEMDGIAAGSLAKRLRRNLPLSRAHSPKPPFRKPPCLTNPQSEES